MRILYFADIRFPLERANGIQTMETCHALAARGHDVALVVRPDTNEPPRDPFEFYGLAPLARLRIERAPAPARAAAARRAAYLAFAAGRVLGPRRADVVMTRDLGVAAILVRIPRAQRPPIVFESHGYAPEVAAALPGLVATATTPSRAKLERLERRERRVWRNADGYVTITAALAQELQGRFGPRRHAAVVPDGTRVPESVEPVRRTGTDMPVVAYAGHLYPWKGVDVLLEAVALVPGVRGLIAGGHEREPDLPRLRGLAERLGIADRVAFTGLLPPRQIPALLAGADVLVLPNPESAISTRFTSPLKLFEYMAAGRPIVASDLPAIREVLTNEHQALLVPPGDPRALSAAVKRLIDDPALGRRLASSALAAVGAFTWDRRAERLEALFRCVTDQHA